jgi:hypothetical protein
MRTVMARVFTRLACARVKINKERGEQTEAFEETHLCCCYRRGGGRGAVRSRRRASRTTVEEAYPSVTSTGKNEVLVGTPEVSLARSFVVQGSESREDALRRCPAQTLSRLPYYRPSCSRPSVRRVERGRRKQGLFCRSL